MFWTNWAWFVELSAYLTVAMIASWFAFARDHSRGRARCPKCWYDMSAAVALTCPECGHQCGSDRDLFRSRTHNVPLFIGAGVCIAGFIWVNYPALRAGLWTRVIPTLALYVAVDPDYNGFESLRKFGTSGVAGSFVGMLEIELARRHNEGELPEWMWRRLTLRNFDMPADSQIRLRSRPTWLRGVPIVVESNAINLWRNRRQNDELWKEIAIGLCTEYPGAGPMEFIPIGLMPQRPVAQYLAIDSQRFALNSQRLACGTYEMPVSLVFREGALKAAVNWPVEVFSKDRTLRIKIVDDIREVMHGLDDPVSNAAVAGAAVIRIHENRTTFELRGTPEPLNFAVAFRLVFIADGVEIARMQDYLIPTDGGGIHFQDAAARARYMPRGTWDPALVPKVTVRIEGRPEACLPQLEYDRYWSGAFERPLADLLAPSTEP